MVRVALFGGTRMAPLAVHVAKWTQPDFKEKAARDNRVQLLTIPYSHYNDASRWALSKAKVIPNPETLFGSACQRVSVFLTES